MTAGGRSANEPMSAAASAPLGRAWRLGLTALLAAGSVIAATSGIALIWFIPYAGVGTLLAIRRPGTSIGWILIGLSWCIALVMATVDATPADFQAGNVDPMTASIAILEAHAGTTLFLLLAILALAFPSGRLPSSRWGTIAKIALGLCLGLMIVATMAPKIPINPPGASTSVAARNPLAVLPDLPIWPVVNIDTITLPLVLLLGASVVSLLVRFRRSWGLERQQLRWITGALGLVIASVLAGFLISAVVPGTGDTGVAWIGVIIGMPFVPIAIGMAVLRYRLYEIDRIVSRTISWALTSGLIGGLFAGLIVALQALLAPVTQQSGLAVAASTLAAAAAFQPVRRRVQAAVDRRFNRSRYDAERIVGAYAAHLRGVTDLREIGDGATDAVARSLGPRGVDLWIRPTVEAEA